MREILFRGKRIDNGEWVEGFYVLDPQADEGKESQIYYTNEHPCGCALVPFAVIPETVGQYTGLIDKDGKKTFEGDIIVDNFFKLLPNKPRVAEFDESKRYGIEENLEIEILGNVFDNPELLEER